MELLQGKTEYSLGLFRFFIAEFEKIGPIQLRATKSMIALDGPVQVPYITQLGKNFVHVVFPFEQAYADNLCFIKIAWVPGTSQYNHHLRIFFEDDVNEEVRTFMKLAYAIYL